MTVPGLPNGCVDNRVIVINEGGKIIWQYGQAGQTGTGPNLSERPRAFACDSAPQPRYHDR